MQKIKTIIFRSIFITIIKTSGDIYKYCKYIKSSIIYGLKNCKSLSFEFTSSPSYFGITNSQNMCSQNYSKYNKIINPS